MAERRPGKKIANSLVTASGAAVLAVYTAGYSRTESAAQQFARRVAERRVAAVSARVASVRDGLDAKVTLIPPGGSPAPERAASLAPAVPKVTEGLDANVTVIPPDGLQAPERPAGVTPAGSKVGEGLDVKVTSILPAPEPPAGAAPAVPKVWKDGTYTGWGFSRHGNIEATVTIEGGRITSAVISQCRTRYSCAVIDTLPPEVAQRQSADVDYVSGATQSADAFYEAVVAALDKAR